MKTAGDMLESMTILSSPRDGTMRANVVLIGLILVIGFFCITNNTQIVEASSFNALDPIPSNNIDEFVQSLDAQLIWQNLGQIGNLETDFYCEFESGFVCFDTGQVEIWTVNDQPPILLDLIGLQQTHPIGVSEAIPLSHFFLGDRGTFTGVKSYHAVEYSNSDIGRCIKFIPNALGLGLEVTSDASMEELVTISNPTDLDIQFKSSQLNRINPVISDEDSKNSMMLEYELIVDSFDSSYAPLTQQESDFTPSQPGVNYTYSTYFGGSSTEYSFDIDVDSDDNVYFCGRTHSSDFPILNGSDSSMGGDRDCFIAKFSPNGDLLYSTYIGGSSYEAGGGSSIAVDTQGNIYLATDTHSSDFPTVNAIDPSYNGDYDVVVCKLNSSGDSLIYSTYLGSSRRDLPESIAVHSDGSAVVVGYTWGSYPIANNGALDAIGNDPGFVTRLSPNGTEFIFSGLIDANDDVQCQGVAFDDEGYIYVASRTFATDFPVVNAYDNSSNGRSDTTIMKLHPNASSIEYSTYIGGSEDEDLAYIDIDGDGNAYVCGRTYSDDFPMVKAFDTTYGWGDIFVVRLNASGESLDFSSYLGGDIINDNEFPYGIVVNDYGYAYVAAMSSAVDFQVVHPIDDTISGDEVIISKIDTNQGRIVYSTYLGGSGNEVEAGGIALDSMDNVVVCSSTFSTDFPTVNAYDSSLGGVVDATLTKIPPLGDSDNDTIFDLDEEIYGTDPYDYDSDNDSMDDGFEIQYGLDPLLNDTLDDLDNDTLTNLEEFNLGTNPSSPDSDNDTLDDAYEVLNGLNPLSPDSDNDTLDDAYEVLNGLNPLSSDSDNDTLDDAYEVRYGLNPLVNDTMDDLDNDTLTNLEEFNLGTNPSSSDSDNDTLDDAYEVRYGLNPLVNDTMDDLDNDTLTNLEEFNLGTNPSSPDSDNDTLDDAYEVLNGLNPLSSDSDNDTLDDAYEINVLGTNPLSSDSDADGYSDAYEVEHGFDPLDPDDPPDTTETIHSTTTETGGTTDTIDFVTVLIISGGIIVAVFAVWIVLLRGKR
ncbi:MAG: SBBP repeat-containing protein [Candidatus Thorarchaeota archaeon]|jgi:hypothetical protein